MAPKRRNHGKKKDGKKRGVSSDVFKHSDAFKNSRLAAGEFGQASKCAVLIRRQLSQVLELTSESDLHRNLSKKIGIIMGRQRVSVGGTLQPNDQPWEQLESFQFNDKTNLSGLLYGTAEVTVVAASGKITINYTGFDLQARLMKYKSGTHGRVIACAAVIDFDKEKAVNDYIASGYIPLKKVFDIDNPAPSITLSLQLPAPVIHPVFVVVGFTCYQQKGRDFDLMGDCKYKALELVYARPSGKAS